MRSTYVDTRSQEETESLVRSVTLELKAVLMLLLSLCSGFLNIASWMLVYHARGSIYALEHLVHD